MKGNIENAVLLNEQHADWKVRGNGEGRVAFQGLDVSG